MWNSYRIIVIPVIAWLITFGEHGSAFSFVVASFRAHLVLGVSVDWTTSSPGGDYFTGVSLPLSLAYWSVSVFLTATLTCMICYRVLRYGRNAQEHFGHEHASLYFALFSIIIESVLPYTCSGIATLVSLGMKSPTSVMFVSIYFLMMVRGSVVVMVLAKLGAVNHSAYHHRCSFFG